jgi:hypothetical protein
MRVKRTKSGKFIIETTNIDRTNIFDNLCNFLEDESVKLMNIRFVQEADVMRHLYYCTLDQLMKRQDFYLQSVENKKWTCTRTEAIALMWSLRHSDNNIDLLEIKSGLHKQLHS